jgi:hypothetical protein
MSARTEERSGAVTLTLRITTRVDFAPIERDRPITNSDFIENAIGSIPTTVFAELEGHGFDIAYPIDGECHDSDRDDTTIET